MTRRVLSLACFLLLGLALAPPCPADDPPAKVLTPEEAAWHPKERVTVRMEVKAVSRGAAWWLNSEADSASEKNFALRVTAQAVAKFRAAGVRDPATHFKGKTVLATGAVRVAEGRAYVVINDPAQIKLADQDGDQGGDKKE